jgi:hypothetical protein
MLQAARVETFGVEIGAQRGLVMDVSLAGGRGVPEDSERGVGGGSLTEDGASVPYGEVRSLRRSLGLLTLPVRGHLMCEWSQVST